MLSEQRIAEGDFQFYQDLFQTAMPCNQKELIYKPMMCVVILCCKEQNNKPNLFTIKKQEKKKKNCMEDIITKLKNVSQFPKA